MDIWLHGINLKNLSVSLDKKLYYSKLNDENISDSDIEHVKSLHSCLKKQVLH